MVERRLALELFDRLPRPLLALLCLALVAGLAVIDYWTKGSASVCIFYALPVSIAAWSLGLRFGFAFSLIAAASIMVTDRFLFEGEAWSPPWWKALVLLLFLSFLALLVATLRHSMLRERRLSRIDPLTGACNARCFYEMGERELERSRRYGRPFSLAYLDLDNFKLVNDTYGHQAGDRVLSEAVSALMRHVRAGDLVARLGGDEFAVLFPETGAEASGALVRKLTDLTLDSIPDEYSGIPTFSVGLMTFEEPPRSLDEAMREVDALMYRVKNSTKNDVAAAVYPPAGPVRALPELA